MPSDAPGSLTDRVYLDIVTYLLEASGFPAGASELRLDPELLASILVVGKRGPGGPVPNFSLVQVIGCLTQNAGNAWMLTRSTEPVRARNSGDSQPTDVKPLDAKPLGTLVFRLLDFPSVGRSARPGYKVQAKGFLIRQPNDDRLNLTSLQVVGETCDR